MPNGIDLLLADHRFVDGLFGDFGGPTQGPNVGRIVDALKAHDDAEHAALYPMCSRLLGDVQMVAECAAAHSRIKAQIDVVMGLEGPPLIGAVEQLKALVTAHVDEEERVLFPELARVATPDQLDELGARILQAKQRVG